MLRSISVANVLPKTSSLSFPMSRLLKPTPRGFPTMSRYFGKATTQSTVSRASQALWSPSPLNLPFPPTRKAPFVTVDPPSPSPPLRALPMAQCPVTGYSDGRYIPVTFYDALFPPTSPSVASLEVSKSGVLEEVETVDTVDNFVPLPSTISSDRLGFPYRQLESEESLNHVHKLSPLHRDTSILAALGNVETSVTIKHERFATTLGHAATIQGLLAFHLNDPDINVILSKCQRFVSMPSINIHSRASTLEVIRKALGDAHVEDFKHVRSLLLSATADIVPDYVSPTLTGGSQAQLDHLFFARLACNYNALGSKISKKASFARLDLAPYGIENFNDCYDATEGLHRLIASQLSINGQYHLYGHLKQLRSRSQTYKFQLSGFLSDLISTSDVDQVAWAALLPVFARYVSQGRVSEWPLTSPLLNPLRVRSRREKKDMYLHTWVDTRMRLGHVHIDDVDAVKASRALSFTDPLRQQKARALAWNIAHLLNPHDYHMVRARLFRFKGQIRNNAAAPTHFLEAMEAKLGPKIRHILMPLLTESVIDMTMNDLDVMRTRAELTNPELSTSSQLTKFVLSASLQSREATSAEWTAVTPTSLALTSASPFVPEHSVVYLNFPSVSDTMDTHATHHKTLVDLETNHQLIKSKITSMTKQGVNRYKLLWPFCYDRWQADDLRSQRVLPGASGPATLATVTHQMMTDNNTAKRHFATTYAVGPLLETFAVGSFLKKTSKWWETLQERTNRWPRLMQEIDVVELNDARFHGTTEEKETIKTHLFKLRAENQKWRKCDDGSSLRSIWHWDPTEDTLERSEKSQKQAELFQKGRLALNASVNAQMTAFLDSPDTMSREAYQTMELEAQACLNAHVLAHIRTTAAGSDKFIASYYKHVDRSLKDDARHLKQLSDSVLALRTSWLETTCDALSESDQRLRQHAVLPLLTLAQASLEAHLVSPTRFSPGGQTELVKLFFQQQEQTLQDVLENLTHLSPLVTCDALNSFLVLSHYLMAHSSLSMETTHLDSPRDLVSEDMKDEDEDEADVESLRTSSLSAPAQLLADLKEEKNNWNRMMDALKKGDAKAMCVVPPDAYVVERNLKCLEQLIETDLPVVLTSVQQQTKNTDQEHEVTLALDTFRRTEEAIMAAKESDLSMAALSDLLHTVRHVGQVSQAHFFHVYDEKKTHHFGMEDQLFKDTVMKNTKPRRMNEKLKEERKAQRVSDTQTKLLNAIEASLLKKTEVKKSTKNPRKEKRLEFSQDHLMTQRMALVTYASKEEQGQALNAAVRIFGIMFKGRASSSARPIFAYDVAAFQRLKLTGLIFGTEVHDILDMINTALPEHLQLATNMMDTARIYYPPGALIGQDGELELNFHSHAEAACVAYHISQVLSSMPPRPEQSTPARNPPGRRAADAPELVRWIHAQEQMLRQRNHYRPFDLAWRLPKLY